MPGKKGAQRPNIYLLLYHKLNFKSILRKDVVCVCVSVKERRGKKGTDEKMKGEKSGGEWKKAKAGINQQNGVGY